MFNFMSQLQRNFILLCTRHLCGLNGNKDNLIQCNVIFLCSFCAAQYDYMNEHMYLCNNESNKLYAKCILVMPQFF